MAIKWVEGFESFGTSGAQAANLRDRYGGNNLDAGNVLTAAGRFSGSVAFRPGNGAAELITPSLGDMTTIICGFAFRGDPLDANQLVAIYEDGGHTLGFNIQTNSDNSLTIRRGTTDLETTAIDVIGDAAWHYVEFKVTIHNSTGSYEVRVDEVEVASDTGVDTQAGSDGNADRVAFFGNAASNDYRYDDWYICDDTGSVNNDFLGSRKVITLFPNAAGDSTDFTPDSGSNFQRVDEVGHDDDTSYVESSTADDEDLYNFDNLSDLSSVDGVQVSAVIRVTGTESKDLKILTKSDTTTNRSDAKTIGSNSYLTHHDILEQDPDTAAAWTTGGVDAAQFGIEVE